MEYEVNMGETAALFFRSFPLLLKGAAMTIQLLVGAFSLSLFFGLQWGILTSNRLKIFVVSSLIEKMTFFYRAVPFYVQLLIVYFVLPDLFGWNFEPFTASVVALGMCSSGYVAQIVRGGINSIPNHQWESAFTLGYTKLQTLRFIILPQMVRNVLPAFIIVTGKQIGRAHV